MMASTEIKIDGNWTTIDAETMAIIDSLPELTGSEKQIEWAWSIRAEYVVKALAQRAAKAQVLANLPAVAREKVLGLDDAKMAAATAETSASVWIARR